MTEQSTQAHEDTEISFLDLLVTLAESWKILLFGPIIAGALAGVLSSLLPKTFESVAIIRMNEEEIALLHAAPVLDLLIDKFGLLAEADGYLDDARKAVMKRLSYTLDKKTKLATITARASTPAAAQALGSNAIEALLKELQVKGQEKALIEKTLAINNRAISNAEEAILSIKRALAKVGVSEQAQESAIRNLVALNASIAKLSQENEELLQKMNSKGEEVFVQEPSLPQRKMSPKPVIWTILVAISTAFSLMLLVFARKAWIANAKKDPKFENKIILIKKYLRG